MKFSREECSRNVSTNEAAALVQNFWQTTLDCSRVWLTSQEISVQATIIDFIFFSIRISLREGSTVACRIRLNFVSVISSYFVWISKRFDAISWMLARRIAELIETRTCEIMTDTGRGCDRDEWRMASSEWRVASGVYSRATSIDYEITSW